ncbi:DUF2357 domain-containing protein [Roseibium aggregatum]|uniref:DUF2357 domain-containing protein n=1 Tax=Roseibium aggregatum TaxID=187304 RepID=UPI0025AD6751|nr:DUF2357 domain-containing protein [Roseibium aggregatum]WJS05498.1 DUF2357 domain-containing protein [Roseibium aggregatum]
MQLDKIVVEHNKAKFSLYPNGVRIFSDERLVEIADGIRGVPSATELENDVPRLNYDSSAEIVQKIQLRDNTDYDFSLELPFEEEGVQRKLEEMGTFPFCNGRLQDVVKLNGPDSWAKIAPSGYRITGRINFREHAGAAFFEMISGDDETFSVPVEVFTRKLDYVEEFQQLLSQISEYTAYLLLRIDSATETNFGVSDETDSSPLAELMAFRRLFRDGRIIASVREVMVNPASRVRSKTTKEGIEFCPNPDWVQLASSPMDVEYMKGGPHKERFLGFTPTNLPNRSVFIDRDTKENRFVKHGLLLLRDRLEKLNARLPKKYGTSRALTERWVQELSILVKDQFWRDVGAVSVFPMSNVMTQRRGYREFLQLFLSFGLGLRLESDAALLAAGEIKPVFHLYEMWCYLMVHKAICEITESDGSDEIFIQNKDRDFSRELGSRKAKCIVFKYTRSSKVAKISLFYNKEFQKLNEENSAWEDSYSGMLNPDISVSIECEEIRHWIHFDAKYRLNMANVSKSNSDDPDVNTFKKDDIHKMHTYRDALLGTRGSYVLYPGSEVGNQLYVRHPDKVYREKTLIPSVGAFPLKPTSRPVGSDQFSAMKQHIVYCIERVLTAKSLYQEEHAFQD